jgi:hypothetical protein
VNSGAVAPEEKYFRVYNILSSSSAVDGSVGKLNAVKYMISAY